MLKLQYKDQRKAAIWLVDERYSIGRDASNEIVIDQDGVSPFHAELMVKGDDVQVMDVGSSTGTFVNGEQISQRTQLKAHDVLRIASIELLLVDPKEELSGVVDDTGATAITPALSNLSVAPAQKAAGKSRALAAHGDSEWSLVVKTGTQVGKEFRIPLGKKVVIGRSNTADIVLAGSHVSRQHAEIEVLENALYVRDLGSANGTYINRKKITEGNLRNGDELRLDTVNLSVKGPELAESPAPAEQPVEQPVEQPAPAAAAKVAPAPPKAATAAPPAAPKPKAAPASSQPSPIPAQAPAQKTAAAPGAPKAAAKGGGNTALIIGVVVVFVAVVAGAALFLF